MLENIAGNEGLPSSELIRDIRTLCSLPPSDIASIADAIAALPEQQDEEESWAGTLSKLSNLKTEPEQSNRAVSVALFLLRRLSDRNITKEQVLSDLAGLQLSTAQLKGVEPLLSVIEKKRVPIAKQKMEAHALGTGTPRIDSAICVVDARAIFQASKHEKLKGDDQEYFRLDRFVPVAILEIVVELNDEKNTHAYLLTEHTLQQLCDILDRTKKRLQVVKKHLVPQEDESGG